MSLNGKVQLVLELVKTDYIITNCYIMHYSTTYFFFSTLLFISPLHQKFNCHLFFIHTEHTNGLFYFAILVWNLQIDYCCCLVDQGVETELLLSMYPSICHWVVTHSVHTSTPSDLHPRCTHRHHAYKCKPLHFNP